MALSSLSRRAFGQTLGEDPILAGTLAANLERGVQSQGIIGDIKHFALNDQESGREAVDVHLDRRSLRESDLLAFQIALRLSDAGAVMCSYNRVNGDYACENQYLLTDVLRKDWRYPGFVVSDWGATHSAAKASHAGLDMEQPGEYLYGTELKAAVERGDISAEELNAHVERILRTMFAAGLFDGPRKMQTPDVERGFAAAQSIAEESIVLLKNEGGILPLRGVRTVAMIGGHADVAVLSGGGSAQVDAPGGSPVPPPAAASGGSAGPHSPVWMPSSPLQALARILPNASVTYDSGEDLTTAVAAAHAAQVAIVFGYEWEAETFDLPTLALSAQQNRLIEAVAAANPRTVVVLENGSPVTMPWMDKVQAIVEAWYPGIRGGGTLARVLTGVVDPSGKLPITFPREDADLPHPKLVLPPPASERNLAGVTDVDGYFQKASQGLPAFDVIYDEGLQVGYKWYDAQQKPVLFPFGFGISYTSYAYSALSVSAGSSPVVSFLVRNTGARAGTEIAQVYASLPAAAGEPPKRLVGWARVTLQPGESRMVAVPVDRDRLTVYDEASDSWKLVPGSYVLRVGSSSQNLPLQGTVTY